MKKTDYSLLVMIIRIVAGVFGVIAFFLMFTHQLVFVKGGANLTMGEIAFGDAILSTNPAPGAFIGYILIAIGAVGSVALIFLKDILGDAKARQLADFIVGGVLALGGLLVVLTAAWFYLANPSVVSGEVVLGGGPIASLVFAVLAAGLNIFNGFVE